MEDINKIFKDLKPLASVSFAYAIRPFLISCLKYQAYEFWLEWMISSNNELETTYISSWNSPLILHNQQPPKYNFDILKRIQHFFIYTKGLNIDMLLKEIFETLIINKHNNNIFIWNLDTLLWESKSINSFYNLIKQKMIERINQLENEYNDLKFYICEDKKNLEEEKFKPCTNILKTQIEQLNYKLNNKIKIYIKNDTNKNILYNNQFPFLIGFGDKYVLDLKTKEKRIRKYDDYFLSTIKIREIKKINIDINFESIYLILGSLLVGENNKVFYILKNKTNLIKILENILGDYVCIVKSELGTNKSTVRIEQELKLYEKRLVIIDQYQKVSEEKLMYLTNQYKNCKFLVCMNKEFLFSKNNVIIIPDLELTLSNDYIFSLMLDGCSKYLNSEITKNNDIQLNKKTYENFLNDMIEVSFDEQNKIRFRDLYNMYLTYMNDKNVNVLKEKEFITILKEEKKYKYKKSKIGFIFTNIRLK